MSDHAPTPPALEEDKPRLTTAQKKQNHIASEKKRRQAIREGFDQICQQVPGLEGQGRSEGLVLSRTVEYIQELVDRRKDLMEGIHAAGGVVDPNYQKAISNAEEYLATRHLNPEIAEANRSARRSSSSGSS